MEEYNEFIHQEQYLELNKTELKKRPLSYQTPDPRFNVDFTFSLEFVSIDCVLRRGSSSSSQQQQLHFLKKTKLPRRRAVVHVSNRRHQLWSDKKAREAIGRELRGLPVRADGLWRLTETAVDKARETIRRMPPHHNQVCLHFDHVKVFNRNVFDEERAIRRANGGEGSAAAAAVCCCVCLEEVLVGKRMPCSHVFHKGCIKKWLETSLVCPVCRFQIPFFLIFEIFEKSSGLSNKNLISLMLMLPMILRVPPSKTGSPPISFSFIFLNASKSNSLSSTLTTKTQLQTYCYIK